MYCLLSVVGSVYAVVCVNCVVVDSDDPSVVVPSTFVIVWRSGGFSDDDAVVTSEFAAVDGTVGVSDDQTYDSWFTGEQWRKPEI